MSETTPAAAKPIKKYDAILRALILAEDPDSDREPKAKLLTPGGAQLLLGWLIAQKSEPKDARALVMRARELRASYPLVWKPLLAMNYIGFSRQCAIHALPAPSWDALQNACSALA